MPPIVSIIVPCLNYGRFLPEALGSLLAQTYPHWECIIVDDGSIDNTHEVSGLFQSKDSRIKYIYQSNHGLSSARNFGLKQCKGVYIQFLDADDKLEVAKLEKQVSYLERHSEVDIVYGSLSYFKEPNVIATDWEEHKDRGVEWIPKVSGVGKEILFPLVQGNIMVVNAPLLRKSVLDDVEGFNQNLLRGYEDWDFWIRCALAGKKIQYLDEEGTRALVRLHHDNMSRNMLSMYLSHIKVREELQNILPSDMRSENNYRIGMMFAKIAKFELSKGEWLQGFKHIFISIWRSHVNLRIFFYLLGLFIPEKIADKLKTFARRVHILQ